MKSSSKLGILAIALLVPAVSIPLFVNAAENSNAANVRQNEIKRGGGMMGNRSVARPMMNSAAREARDATRQTEVKAKIDAVEKAISANDYNAWVTAVGANSPIAKEVTKDEFSTFIEAHNLMKQAQAKLTSIGVTHNGRGEGWGLGKVEDVNK